VALAAALAAALAGQSAVASGRGSTRVGHAMSERVGSRPAAVRAYWTSARMRAARPARLLAPGAVAERSRSPHPPVVGGGRLRDHRRRRLAALVGNVRDHPTRTHGKVFFTAIGTPYQCSGTAVSSPSRSLVLTAGHCAYFTAAPGFHNAVHHWIFVPAYDRGRAPFGEWPATTLAAPAGWVASDPVSSGVEIFGGDSRYDVGAATVAPRHGRTLQDTVGGLSVGFDLPRHRRYAAFGYPAVSPFGGGREFSCESAYTGSDGRFQTPRPMRISCDMTAGASGGGWVDGRGRLVSVTSYAYSNDSDSLYGPYFGAAMRSFLASVRNG